MPSQLNLLLILYRSGNLKFIYFKIVEIVTVVERTAIVVERTVIAEDATVEVSNLKTVFQFIPKLANLPYHFIFLYKPITHLP